MNDNKKIKGIIFDLSEVLLTGIKNTGIVLAEKHRLEDIKAVVSWTPIRTPLVVPLVEELFHGDVSEDEYISSVLREYPMLGQHGWLKDHILNNFKEVEGTREIILKLRSRGYKMALLSVHAKEWIEYCEKKFDFHKLFDVLCYSYVTKVSKPDPASFQNALKALDAGPEECIFIDDSQVNIDAAQRLGIFSILFTTATDLERELKRILPGF